MSITPRPTNPSWSRAFSASNGQRRSPSLLGSKGRPLRFVWHGRECPFGSGKGRCFGLCLYGLSVMIGVSHMLLVISNLCDQRMVRQKKNGSFCRKFGKFFPNLHSQFRKDARVAKIAQSVEHFIRNEKVVGSSPTFGSGAGDGTGESLSRFFLLAYSFVSSPNGFPGHFCHISFARCFCRNKIIRGCGLASGRSGRKRRALCGQKTLEEASGDFDMNVPNETSATDFVSRCARMR